jgi:inhibitor of cysteine peptidase
MRRALTPTLLILLVLTLVLFATSCAGNPPEPLQVGADSNNGTATIEQDQTLEITLEGNPTTGYAWVATETGEPTLRLEGEPEYVEGNTDQTLVGGGGQYVFRFVGVEKGTAAIELVYQRSWEAADPLDRFSLEVTVK